MKSLYLGLQVIKRTQPYLAAESSSKSAGQSRLLACKYWLLYLLAIY